MQTAPITQNQFEARLEDAERMAAGRVEGLFGPGSAFWRVNREAIVFLGAGRALLLQLAHPFVAQAIADHSPVKHDPWGRYYGTMPPVFTMVYGPLDAALAEARAVYRIHRRIAGVLPETVGAFAKGTPYRAAEAHAALWVHATLWDTALLCHSLVFPPLSGAERDRYTQESRRFAALFGIPDEMVPGTGRDFDAYVRAMSEGGTLGVGEAGRDIAGYFFGRGKGAFGRYVPKWYRALTVHLMPPRLAEEFGFPLEKQERARAERALKRIRTLYPRLPDGLRFTGPYQDARARVAGQPGPGPWVRAVNRLWLGRPALVRDSSSIPPASGDAK